MNEAMRAAGYEPYNVSMSNHDIERGNRYFYFAKDLTIPYRNDPVTDNTGFVFCDVDYYADMEKWMQHFKPMLLYTLVPESLSYHCDDHSFYVNDDRVFFDVRGGASYNHQLWDYTGDTICVRGKNKELLVFTIEQKCIQGDPHRRIIFLEPAARVAWPFYKPMKVEVGLKRKCMTAGQVNVLYEPIDDRISLSASGSRHTVETTGRTLAAITARMKNKTSPPMVADVERILRDAGDKEACVNAPILFELIPEAKFRVNVVKTTATPTHFQPLGPLRTEDGETCGHAVTTTLAAAPALLPMRGVNSDVATVNGRVKKPTNTVIPFKEYKEYASEFVEFLVPEPGVGHPWDTAAVREVQDNRQQKARINMVAATVSTHSSNRLKAFIKAEAYAATNDPRNITTMAPELTLMMSCFTYAFKEKILYEQPWYGPGKTPKQVGRRLQSIAKNGTLESDYSRFDGSISEWLQKNVVKAAYMRFFKEDQRTEFQSWFSKVFMQMGTTTAGVRYEAGWGTRSGSPITTDGNTMLNAFVVYCCYRKLCNTPAEAWRKLSQGALLTGDDAVLACENGLEPALLDVVKNLGLKVEAKVNGADDPVSFCGRIYPRLSDCITSFQDPLRTIPKLHLTTNKGVTPEQAAANRAHGYLATDKATPIIGTWARRVIELTGNLKVKGATREEQYKLSNAHQQLDPSLIETAMANILGIDVGELKALDKAVSEAKALDQMPVVLGNCYKHKIEAVVGGEVVGPGPRVETVEPNHEQSSGTPEVIPEVAGHSERRDKPSNPRPGGKAEGFSSKAGKPRVPIRPAADRKAAAGSGNRRRPPNGRRPIRDRAPRGGGRPNTGTTPPVSSHETTTTTAVVHASA